MVDSEKFLDIWSIIKPRFVKAGRVSFFLLLLLLWWLFIWKGLVTLGSFAALKIQENRRNEPSRYLPPQS